MRRPLPLACALLLLCASSPSSALTIQKRRHDDDGGGMEFLHSLPMLVDQIVNATITIVSALKEAVKEGAMTQNGLVGVLAGNGSAAAAGACPDVAVLFARGTKEPGNVGFLTGPPFFEALQTYTNTSATLAIQGIDYTATINNYKRGGDPVGAALMAMLARRTLAACPRTKLTLAGYSQGAQLVHLACAQLPANATAAVSSAVLFGDPLAGQALAGVDAGRVLSVCHPGDDICVAGGSRTLVTGAHLNYSVDAPAAAMFVMQRSRLGMASGDAVNQGMQGTLAGMVLGLDSASRDGMG